MTKYVNLNVHLKSGVEFMLKVKGDDFQEVASWLGMLVSVDEYTVVSSIAQKPPHTRHENGISAARIAKGMTQQDLADAIGVAQQHVQRWEAGLHRPSIEVLMKMGKALGVDWTTLVEV